MSFFKRNLSLVIAIVFATISSLGIYYYLDKRESVSMATSAIAPEVTQTLPVVVAKKDMFAGQRTTLDDLKVSHWPKQIATDQYFQNPSQLVGRILKVNVIADEPVTKSKVLAEDEGFSSLIPDNKSAVAVRLPQTHALAKVLEKGAYVDVFVTSDQDGSRSSTRVITRTAHVMSVIDRSSEAAKGVVPDLEIVLLVSSHFVPQIVHAMNHGQIELALSGKYQPVMEVR